MKGIEPIGLLLAAAYELDHRREPRKKMSLAKKLVLGAGLLGALGTGYCLGSQCKQSIPMSEPELHTYTNEFKVRYQ